MYTTPFIAMSVRVLMIMSVGWIIPASTFDAMAQAYNSRRQGLIVEAVKKSGTANGSDVIQVLYYNAPDQSPSTSVELGNVRVWVLASGRWQLFTTEYSNSREDFVAGEFYGKPLRTNILRATGRLVGRCQTVWVEGLNPVTNRLEWDAVPCSW
jgi:hypothetical protein